MTMMKPLKYTLTIYILLLCAIRVAFISHVNIVTSTTTSHGHARPSHDSIQSCPNIVIYWIETSGLNFEDSSLTLSTMVTENFHSSPCIFCVYKS